MFKVLNEMLNLDRDDLLIREKGDLRGNGRRLRKGTCRSDIKKNSFAQRYVEILDGQADELVQAKTVSPFKGQIRRT